MRLKKMEITGFKSFVDKVAVQFPAGVSAIVGPNGCGKSNIVDALRWAMGEQSVKQLRGKAMEDVIFAGTNGRPPLNMAEVSLILSNENGDGPEELRGLSEVMVTRRLYRSGESAYLLNKRPCRLKDITNIFLGSGMGARSYAVIQQGNIGAITEAGPEERRFFIEEAAGISRYKQRKKEALRKMEATQANLLRVNDIIAEVERQLATLKRQAQKARRYQALKARIKELDIRLTLHGYDRLSQEIQKNGYLLKELKDSDLEHSARLQKLDAAVEDIQLRRKEKSEAISARKSEQFESQRRIDKTENELAHLRQELERLARERADLEQAQTELEEKNQQIHTEMAEARTEKETLDEKVQSLQAQLARDQGETEAVKNQLAELQATLEAQKSTLTDRTAQEARYQNILENTQDNKQNLKRRLKRADEAVALAEKKLAESRTEEQTAQEELTAIQSELSDLEAEIADLRESRDHKAAELSAQVKTVQGLEFERGKLKSRYSGLKKMEQNLEGFRDGVKAVMKAELDGVRGLVADLIAPESDYETAVEAVLGEALQYVVVAQPADGTGAIEFLKAQNAGRGGFLPLAGLKPPEPRLPDGGAERLSDHVQAEPGFEALTETLLGRAAVVPDLETGLEIYRANGHSALLVTRQGDLITPEGALLGGSPDKLSGILAQKAELRELEARITDLQERLAAEKGTQKELEGQLREADESLQKSLSEKQEARDEEMAAQKRLYQASEALKQAGREQEMAQMEQESLLGESDDLDEKMEKYQQALADIQAKVRSAQEAVSQTSSRISERSEQAQARENEVVELRLELTGLTAKQENLENALRRLGGFEKDGQTRLEQLSEDIRIKGEKTAQAEQAIQDAEQTLSEIYQGFKALAESLEAEEADFEAIDAQLRENDASASRIRKEREAVLQKVRMLEVEQSQRKLKRDNLAEGLNERYGKGVPELRAEMADSEEKTESADPEKMADELKEAREKLENFGDVNLGAIAEYERQKERYDFLVAQRQDLVAATEDLHKVIQKINRICEQRFLKVFHQVNEKLAQVFPRLFDGGAAKLELTEPNQPLDTGVEFMVHPPGKKLTRLSLLSGGEKALSAIAFIFSIFLIKPTSFCIMDEIDAPLDDANVYRFNELLKIIGEQSQIIMITHKKKSMEFADTLFGVTMEKRGISKVVSVNFEGVEEIDSDNEMV